MRISFILQDLYRLGAQYVTALVARGLARRGHDVEVVVSAVQTKIGRERPDLKPFELPPEVPFEFIAIPQYETERVLREHLSRLGTTVERGLAVSSFEQDDSGVDVALRRSSAI